MVLPYFSTLSYKRRDFRKKKFTEHEMSVLIFSANLSEAFLVLRITHRDIVISVKPPSCNVSFIFVRFQ
jgi:hypothetical protein